MVLAQQVVGDVLLFQAASRLAAASKSQAAGRYMARDLTLGECSSVDSTLKTWTVIDSSGNAVTGGSGQAACTVPTISAGVLSWSGTNCASGASNVASGTTCQITAQSGYTCTSPGVCTNGNFAATGACQATGAFQPGLAVEWAADHTVVPGTN